MIPLSQSGWKGMNQGGNKSSTQHVPQEAWERIFGPKKDKIEVKVERTICNHENETRKFMNEGNQIPRWVFECNDCGNVRNILSEDK